MKQVKSLSEATHVTLATEIIFPYSGITLRQRKKYPVRVYTAIQVEYAPLQWAIIKPDQVLNMYTDEVYYVFDNPDTYDQYTVIDKHGDCLGLSAYPDQPTGFNQFSTNCLDDYMFHSFGPGWRNQCDVKKIERHVLPEIIADFEKTGRIGKRIKLRDLPDNIQKIVKERFS